MQSWMATVVEVLGSFLWGPGMLITMGAVGLYLTVGTRFFQVRQCRRISSVTLGSMMGSRSGGRERGISPFQAVSTALAGTMGVGNITGIATALTAGGPGAVFWMWMSALFGMMTKYAEVVLAVHYRIPAPDGSYRGGPMYYMREGLGMPRLGGLFALVCIAAALGGNMVQTNALCGALDAQFGVAPLTAGIVTALVAALVVFGGAKRIAQASERLIPLVSVLYTGGCLVILCMRFDHIPSSLALVMREAFAPQSAAGGLLGYGVSRAMRFGFARGVYSNEAGLGSASIAHACAETNSAVEQGMLGIFEVFFDTIISCTLTALVLLSSPVLGSGLNGSALTATAFSQALGSWGGAIVAVSLCIFALSAMLCWSLYGERCLEYLGGGRGWVLMYRLVFVLVIVAGSVARLEVIWDLADVLNGAMALPNLFTVVLLSPTVFTQTRRYLAAQKL